jgi:hypothetical protein
MQEILEALKFSLEELGNPAGRAPVRRAYVVEKGVGREFVRTTGVGEEAHLRRSRPIGFRLRQQSSAARRA